MMKRLLPAWQKSIDAKVSEEMKIFLATNRPMSDASRAIWYNVCSFMDEEVKNGDMLKEFRPFANAYAKESIAGAINFEVNVFPSRKTEPTNA